jgi:predicted lipoprotein
MEIVSKKSPVKEIQTMAERMFGNFVKAVVDVERRIMAIDAELHADEEALLLENGSRQEDLWGINIYPFLDRNGPDFVEFDSMINLRPSQGNRSRGVENADTRNKIISIVNEWIEQ